MEDPFVVSIQHGERPEAVRLFSRREMWDSPVIKVMGKGVPTLAAEWFLDVHRHQGINTGAEHLVAELLGVPA